MNDGSLITDELRELYGGEAPMWPMRPRANEWHAMALAYMWGRQDGGSVDPTDHESAAFASVYSLAQHVTGGYAGPLQSAHHEWRDTGRLLVVMPDGGPVVAVARTGPEGRAEVRHIPWADGTMTPYWPGIVAARSTAAVAA